MGFLGYICEELKMYTNPQDNKKCHFTKSSRNG